MVPFTSKEIFLNSIVSQANHLKKNIKFEKSYTKRLEIFTALILTGLVFKEYRNNFDVGIKELEKLIKTFFDKDGFPLTRNPGDLIFSQNISCFLENVLRMHMSMYQNF